MGRHKPQFRFTIRIVMNLVVLTAVNFALIKALDMPWQEWSSVTGLVVLYDLLLLSILGVVCRLRRHRPGDPKPGLGTLLLAVVAIGGCAGMPLVMAVRLILRGR